MSDTELIALPLAPVPISTITRSGECVVVSSQLLLSPELEAPRHEPSIDGSVCGERIIIESEGFEGDSMPIAL